ncbi:unnamed protein product [Calypogeia fissa]
MEMPTAPSQRKRVRFSYSDDDSDAEEAPRVKKARFPKGKKDSGKTLSVIDGEEDEGAILSTDPRVAALERATRRDKVSEQLLSEDTAVPQDVAIAEEDYGEEAEERLEDGMRIEPFNLKQEREEGYFDADGNYVEYRNEDDTKDAWLDSVEVDTRFASKAAAQSTAEDSGNEKGLSKREIADTQRRIANSLQPGETVLRALRRLKAVAKEEGARNGRMEGDTKVVFDQLTEDAMKLLDNGDYNIYEEKKETLQREVEGYEAILGFEAGLTNGAGPSSAGEGGSDMFADTSAGGGGSDMFADTQDEGQEGISSIALGLPSRSDVKGNGSNVDIFGDGEGDEAVGNSGDGARTGWGQERVQQENSITAEGAVPLEGSGYVFDESSGYYYNSELGYYYDVNSGLYCSASTHQWYKFDEDQNTYVEVTS